MATAGPFILPSTARVAPTGTLTFAGSGGSGTGYTWYFSQNQSGGTINSATGAYTAGSVTGIDLIQVLDSAMSSATVPVVVQNGPTLSALTTQAQQRGDFVNSNFISSAEWTNYINGSAFRL
jgi:hypothetical protein